MNKLVIHLIIFTGFIFSLNSCKNDDEKPKPIDDEESIIENNSVLIQQIKENYANIAYAVYKDSYDQAIKLEAAVNNFVKTPTQKNFDATKQTWLNAREPYGQSESFRFANGPIDSGDTADSEGLINAWPLDESYIDYTRQASGGTTTGIINDLSKKINETLLEELNEQGGEENISIGYHAIEFLLWGQDSNKPTNGTANTTGGERSYTDYVTDGTGTAQNQLRRGEYLKICAKLLVKHLKVVVDQWDVSKKENYRSLFLAMDNKQAMRNMLSGLATLSASELANERMFVALNNNSQEDEQSCFSDNTHRDIRLNLIGIKNVYYGSYKKTNGSTVSGKSLNDLINRVNKEKAEEINNHFDTTVQYMEKTAIPFDFAIFNDTDKPGIEKTVKALRKLGTEIKKAGIFIGIDAISS